jgi:hypothetical protein
MSMAVGLIANIAVLTNIVEPLPGIIVFVAAVSVYVSISLFAWRCPTCKKYPGNSVMPDFCERCGAAIFGPDARIADRPVSPGTTGRRRLRYIIAGRLLFGLILLSVFAFQIVIVRFVPAWAYWLAAVGLIVFGAWAEWQWWRCPHCGGYLKRSIWPGTTCTKCGKALEL